jgi:dihydroorotase
VIAAQQAGIVFDVAHGRAGHFNFPLAQRALDDGFAPSTISTDLTWGSATHGPVYDLPTTMVKLLHLGMTLDDVVARSTYLPARVLGLDPSVGTLRIGADADIAVFTLQDGRFELPDTDGNTITARQRLVAEMTFRNGREWYRRAVV